MSKPMSLGYSIHSQTGQGARLQHPVILVRGLGRSSGFWLRFLEEMRVFGEVVCIDLFGTGKSLDIWGRGSVETNAKDLIETLRIGNFGPCHLVGISFGGMVALEAAAHGGLATLTVLSSSARATGLRRLDPKAGLKLFAALRNWPPHNREFAPYLVSPETLKAQPQLPEVWDQLWKKEGFQPLAVVRQLLAAGLFSGKRTLQNINLPAHFMVSKDDLLVPWLNTVEMWRLSRASQMTVLEKWGHDFPTEAPKEVAEKIADFLFRAERQCIRSR